MKMHTTSAIVVLLASTAQVMGSSRTASDVDDGLNGHQNGVVTPRHAAADGGEGNSPKRNVQGAERTKGGGMPAPLTADNLAGHSLANQDQRPRTKTVISTRTGATDMTTGTFRAADSGLGTHVLAMRKDARVCWDVLAYCQHKAREAADKLTQLDPERDKQLTQWAANYAQERIALSHLLDLAGNVQNREDEARKRLYNTAKGAIANILRMFVGVLYDPLSKTYNAHVFSDAEATKIWSSNFVTIQASLASLGVSLNGSANDIPDVFVAMQAVDLKYQLKWGFSGQVLPQKHDAQAAEVEAKKSSTTSDPDQTNPTQKLTVTATTSPTPETDEAVCVRLWTSLSSLTAPKNLADVAWLLEKLAFSTANIDNLHYTSTKAQWDESHSSQEVWGAKKSALFRALRGKLEDKTMVPTMTLLARADLHQWCETLKYSEEEAKAIWSKISGANKHCLGRLWNKNTEDVYRNERERCKKSIEIAKSKM